MKQTLFFYDLETSGLRPRADRIMQFAGQRTDMDLKPIGEPVNLLVKMTDDALPSPGAIMVTKITPQQTLQDGLTEAEFAKYVTEEVFTPGTVALGYNTVRFDDEFMRAMLWRNFHEPYEWEWKDGRSRWDMLDVVRLTRALRPEGIEWPFTEDGKPTNRLELLTKCNGLSHEHAHDALSDVYATIAVAKLIKEKQPSLFKFLFENRGKREVARYVDLNNPAPFVYASGRYGNEFNKTTVVYPIGPGRNGNVLVYDLRYNLEEVLKEEEPKFYPLVKELSLNKCPAVAPLSVLTKEDGWAKIGLSPELIEKNLEILKNHSEFIHQRCAEIQKAPEYPPAVEPEQALYDGFLNDADRVKVEAVRNADKNALADFHPDFDDARLPELLLHYKGRNFPEALSESEAEEYDKYRLARLQAEAPKYLEELEKVDDEFLREELKLYLESIL
ncbi:MAG: exodeoxyribonuclease I [Candidatus Saccharibacteria bacterium]|nr:exodeoxyribonuclease I [Candidatus Saccharibacteria bacterium]